MKQSIDDHSVDTFWSQRSVQEPVGDPNSLVYFENDNVLQQERIAHEIKVLFPRLGLSPSPNPVKNEMNILDLGGGYGQWSLRFAPFVKQVFCVDFQQAFLDRGKAMAIAQKLDNIEFVCSRASRFMSDKLFDRVFISGVLMYMNDPELAVTVDNIRRMLKSDGNVIVMEPCSVLSSRYIVDNKFSIALQNNYSALYRTAAELKEMFSNAGIRCVEDLNLFEDGSGHDKFPETRQRVYVFEIERA